MSTAMADGLIAVVQCATMAQPPASDDDWDCDGQPWDAQCPSDRPASSMAPSCAIPTALVPLIRSVPSISALPECTLRWLPVAIVPLDWSVAAPQARCVHPTEVRKTLRVSRRAPRRRSKRAGATESGIPEAKCNRRPSSVESHAGAESVPESNGFPGTPTAQCQSLHALFMLHSESRAK